MNLDKTKPYGHIYGHPNALFEQGGMLFDGAGSPAVIEESVPTEEQVEVGDWLKEMLDGGPMAQTALYKEAENLGHCWDDVKKAAVSMQVKKYVYAKTDMWKLIPN